MKIDSKTVVTVDITVDELKQLAQWALKKQSIVSNDAEVEFTISQDVKKTEGQWTEVPPDWQQLHCPDPNIDYRAILEIELRDGTRYIDHAYEWSSCWFQGNRTSDIVRYRAVT